MPLATKIQAKKKCGHPAGNGAKAEPGVVERRIQPPVEMRMRLQDLQAGHQQEDQTHHIDPMRQTHRPRVPPDFEATERKRPIGASHGPTIPDFSGLRNHGCVTDVIIPD